MSFSVISGELSAAVADAGTFTASYPGGKKIANFYGAMGHKLVIGQNDAYSFPGDFNITLGASSITITNASGTTWPQGAVFRLQLEEQGTRAVRTDVTGTSRGALLASATQSNELLVSFSPDVADADGISVSATVTSPANAVIGGALASGGIATFDTPRNVVGAWTNTATVTFTGTDVYGNAMTETSASGTSHTGAKAFKTVTQVKPSATITSATFGSGNVIGMPVFLPSAGAVRGVQQDGVDLVARVAVQFEIEQTQLLAGTAEDRIAPIAGFVDRLTTIVQTAVTTGGPITVNVGTTPITGLTVTVADAATKGTIQTDQPTTITGNDATTQVAARGRLSVVPDASFATAGEVDAIVEINGWGVFQPGIRTSNGSTATTGDVRGTFRPPVDPDGSITFQVLMSLADSGFTGIAQA